MEEVDEERMPNSISIVDAISNGLAKANLILIRITTKDKVVVLV